MPKLKTKKGGDWVPPKLVIYGEEKSGKTTTATQAPRPLYIGTDNGCRRLDVDYLDPPETWLEFVEQLQFVAEYAKADGFETIVTDTLNGVVDLCAQWVCQTMYGGKWDDPKYGFLAWGAKGWNGVDEQMRKVLPLYDKLIDSGVWVVMLMHQRIERITLPEGGEYTRWMPAVHKTVWPRIGQWVDATLRIDYDKSTAEVDGHKRVITDGTRLLRCGDTLADVAGTRAGYELPAEMPLSWASIEAHIGNVNFVDELAALIADLDATEGVAALEWLGVDLEHLGDAPTHKVVDLIGRLRSRANG